MQNPLTTSLLDVKSYQDLTFKALHTKPTAPDKIIGFKLLCPETVPKPFRNRPLSWPPILHVVLSPQSYPL